MSYNIVEKAKESFPWAQPGEGTTHYAGSWSTDGPTDVKVTCPGCFDIQEFGQSGDLRCWAEQHWTCVRPYRFYAAGTPNWTYTVSPAEELGRWNVSREIDTSRESAIYPGGTGPWTVAEGIDTAAVFELLDQAGCLVDSDWYTQREKRRKADVADCVRLSGNKDLTPEQVHTHSCFALVSGAKTVFRLTVSHAGWGDFRAALNDCRRQPIDKCFGSTWAEAIDKHGMRVVPVNEDDLKKFRRQAEDCLRKAGLLGLPELLNALAIANTHFERYLRL